MERTKSWIKASCGVAVIVAFSGCASMRTSIHSNWLSQPSHRIAVLPFNGEEPFGEELSDTLVTELMSRGFTVIERSELKKVFTEYRLQYTGAFDPLTLVENGKLAGVDFIVMGSVSTRSMVPAVEWLLGDGETIQQIDMVRIRWVNVRNGQIMASTRFRNSRGGSVEKVAIQIAKSMDNALKFAASEQQPHAAKTKESARVTYVAREFAR